MAKVTDQKTIGLRISGVRTDMNLSQEKFAETLNVSRNTMGSIERGETAPSLATLSNLFEKTSMTPDYLFLTPEAQSVAGRFTQLTAELDPNEVEELLRFAEIMAAGFIAKRKHTQQS